MADRLARQIPAGELRRGDTVLDPDGRAWRVMDVREPDAFTVVLDLGDPPWRVECPRGEPWPRIQSDGPLVYRPAGDAVDPPPVRPGGP